MQVDLWEKSRDREPSKEAIAIVLGVEGLTRSGAVGMRRGGG